MSPLVKPWRGYFISIYSTLFFDLGGLAGGTETGAVFLPTLLKRFRNLSGFSVYIRATRTGTLWRAGADRSPGHVEMGVTREAHAMTLSQHNAGQQASQDFFCAIFEPAVTKAEISARIAEPQKPGRQSEGNHVTASHGVKKSADLRRSTAVTNGGGRL